MAGVSVTMELEGIRKLKRLRKGTGVTFREFSKSTGRRVARKHKPKLLGKVRKYAPKRKGQKYIRTFRLRRAWDVSIRTPNNGVVVSVDNDTPYAHYVVGKPDLRMRAGGKGQAWMHEGRWWIAGGVIRKQFLLMEDDMESDFIKTLEKQADVNVRKRSKLLG